MIRRSPPLMLLATVLTMWLGARLILAWPQPAAMPDPVVWADAGKALPASMPVELTARPASLPGVGVEIAADSLARLAKPHQLSTSPGWPSLRQPVASHSAIRLETQSGPIGGTSHYVRLQSLMLATHAAHSELSKGRPFLANAGRMAMTGAAFPLPPRRSTSLDHRWSGAAWLALRGGGSRNSLSPTATQALLGGSQAGARLSLLLDRRGRAEAYARLVTVGSDLSGAEAAAGIAWRPSTAAPLRIAVERRQRVSGPDARSAFAVMAVAGVSDMTVPHGWRLDGYGAAGVVGLSRRDTFAEGSLQAARPIATLGPVRVSAGLGAWGAAQPGASRLDAGPLVTLQWDNAVPRLSLDWRQRLAGNATPDSGVALTLATDF